MQENHLYEYAVIRLVPRVEREEFINVGLVMFCKQQRWLKARSHIRQDLLHMLAPQCEYAEMHSYLNAFVSIAGGQKDSGPIGKLDAASRFRWLTAVRSSVLQTSRPHPGLCNDLELKFEKLFSELVI
jgi:hypothetical protein